MPSYKNESTERLFKVIASINTAEECRAFFEDLCTIKEIKDMAQRFDTALLLSEGLSYQNISKAANVSSATICRVNRCLEYGDGGYAIAINKLNEVENK